MTNLGALLAQGGWAMVPIYACSVVAMAVFARKFVQVRRAQLGNMGWLPGALEAISEGDHRGAMARCAKVPHPAARVVAATASTLISRPDRAEAEAKRVGSLELQRLEHHLGLLSFIAQAAPLLGLLGTVLGMVDLFAGLGSTGLGNVDASLLSGGIWKALLTTAAGLIVAVPTLAAYSWLAGHADQLRLQMADAAQQALTAAPLEGPEEGRVDRQSLSLVSSQVADGV